MKKLPGNGLRIIIAALIMFPYLTYAQKLPNMQTANVPAPANIKIDGKANEWNNQFQAYNKATSVFYTVANDDDHLYLAIQAADIVIVEKILSGGITINLKRSDKKNSAAAISPSTRSRRARSPRNSFSTGKHLNRFRPSRTWRRSNGWVSPTTLHPSSRFSRATPRDGSTGK